MGKEQLGGTQTENLEIHRLFGYCISQQENFYKIVLPSKYHLILFFGFKEL